MSTSKSPKTQRAFFKKLIAGVATASLLTAGLATPAAAQDDLRVITADELYSDYDNADRYIDRQIDRREQRRQLRRAERQRGQEFARGGEYIRTPSGDYVLIEDRRFRKGLRAGHRVQGDGYYGRRAYHEAPAPVRIAPPVHHHNSRNNTNVAIAAGIVGLAAGAIIANEFGRKRHNQHQHGVTITHPPVYQEPIPVRRIERVPLSQLQGQQRQVSHVRGGDGWIGSREWLRHCTAKYRSFNPATGKFLSYSGQYKLCR